MAPTVAPPAVLVNGRAGGTIADRLARNLALALDGAPPIEWRGRTAGTDVVCMGATALAGRVGPSPRWAYAPLLLLLAAGALVPLRALLGLPLGPAAAVALFTTPLLFAGLLFGASFRRTPSPGQALGANVLGSLAGGFLELASFHVGLPGLLWIAALLSALSWPRPSPAPAPST